MPAGSCAGVEILRWQVGDATILRIREVDATAAFRVSFPSSIRLLSPVRHG